MLVGRLGDWEEGAVDGLGRGAVVEVEAEAKFGTPCNESKW